ncbi:MAG: ABC transporter ATP-binding protein [Candidatus Pacebacteria bacterium]|nr:ABC transporter ATP-binding protein [Candidatus Paceibacterota bacterium]
MKAGSKKKVTLFEILKPYTGMIILILVFTISSSALSLFIPKIISSTIDSIGTAGFDIGKVVFELVSIAISIFILTCLENVVQTYTSEKAAKDLRNQVITKISKQDYNYIEKITSAKILTNLTSDVDSIKLFISSAVSSIISSLFMIVGASTLLFMINWKLALVVIMIIPLIGIIFSFVLVRVHKLFIRTQEAIDRLNKVINESIVGSTLIRILNSQKSECDKFVVVNSEARDIGVSILKHFSLLIPTINFVANLAALAILLLGGYQVIGGTMTIGEFTAFNSYLLLLIFPIIVISFMTNVISQANASYGRVKEILEAEEAVDGGRIQADILGKIEVRGLSIKNGERNTLKDVNFVIEPGTRTAIIGPTAGGKTQLIYSLVGLIKPSVGGVYYDDKALEDYRNKCFYKQIGLVFQDSVIFNLTIKENIAFSRRGHEGFDKAISTAELQDFIATLPNGLDTVLSERGSNLSGGQKQRIVLARALANNPKVLLLDDFTARVDPVTEKKILDNVKRNYPGITIISVTQKIDPVKDYDNIILLMEGEVLAIGKHDELLRTSPEYCQIYNSQKSTNQYELQAE